MTLHYVPAGVEGYSLSNAQIYIRNRPNQKESTEFGSKFKRWSTLERTVMEAVSSSRGSVIPPDTYDCTFPIFSPMAIRNAGVKRVLANPVVGKAFVKEPFSDVGISSIVDSGGFQMLTGASEFVHPDEVIERYNKVADIGMPLDVPVRSKYEAAHFHQISHLMKANDDYIIPRLNKNVDLALVSHGSNLALRKARLDVLDRKAKVVAIAGLGIAPPPGVDRAFAAIENLMYVVTRMHKTTEYFHVLGVTSKLWMFIYALLDQADYVQNIGADSVSHRLSALVGIYETMDFDMIELAKNRVYKTVPMCNCPVCFAVDDLRIVHSWRILEAHNLWVRAKQAELMCELARSYLKGLITLREILQAINLKMQLSKFTTLIGYLETIMGTGKFVPLRTVSSSKGLFNKTSTSKKIVNPHYTKVVANYEKFHGRSFKAST